jgi:hypothetical protein
MMTPIAQPTAVLTRRLDVVLTISCKIRKEVRLFYSRIVGTPGKCMDVNSPEGRAYMSDREKGAIGMERDYNVVGIWGS